MRASVLIERGLTNMSKRQLAATNDQAAIPESTGGSSTACSSLKVAELTADFGEGMAAEEEASAEAGG